MSEGTVEHFPVLADADLLEEGAADVPADLDEVQVGLWSRRVAVVGYVGAGRALGLDDFCGVIDESVTVRGVTNSWLRQNRISEYGEYGQKWAIFVFSNFKTAFFEHQIRFSE